MTNEDYDTVSFAGQAERAVFRPDRGSDPTMSPAGGGLSSRTTLHELRFNNIPRRRGIWNDIICYYDTVSCPGIRRSSLPGCHIMRSL